MPHQRVLDAPRVSTALQIAETRLYRLLHPSPDCQDLSGMNYPEHDPVSPRTKQDEIHAEYASQKFFTPARMARYLKAPHKLVRPIKWRVASYLHAAYRVVGRIGWRAAVYLHAAYDFVTRVGWRAAGYFSAKLRPRIWILQQYEPIKLSVHRPYSSRHPLCNLPRIAIVTPSYNQGTFLKETIDSVLGQNYPKLTYFVQDGASTDNTMDILKSYGDRLRWDSGQDRGQAHAINRGFSRVEGDIMAYLNSDDVLLPSSLNYVAQAFYQDPALDVIYSHRVCINEEGGEIAVWLLPWHNRETIKWADFIPQETMFWRKRVWDAIGPFDESLHYTLDWEFILRANAKGLKFRRVPRFLACFRVHSNQKTTANIAVGSRESDFLREKYLGFVPTQKEINRALRYYVRQHVVFDLLYRLRLYGRVEVKDIFRFAFGVRALKPWRASLRLRLAATELEQGSISGALDRYQRVLDIAPDLPEAHYGWGDAALRLGRHGEAMEAFTRAFERGHPEAGLRLAAAELERGSVSGALDRYQRVLDIASDRPEAHYGWATAALRLGRHGEAMEAFARAFERGYDEAGLRLAAAELERGSISGALDRYQRVLDIAPDLPEAHYGWGDAALRLGRHHEAMEAFARAFERGHPEAGLRLAAAELEQGSVSDALDRYRRILDVAPDLPEAHYGWGAAALRLGRHGEAMEAFAHAFERGHAEAGLRLAAAELERGSISGALDRYQQVLDIAPDLPEAHYGWGTAALRLGRHGEALEAFAHAFERGHPEAGLRLAAAELEQGSISGALDRYRRVLNLAPDLAEAHYGWGAAALQLGRHSEAMEALRRALVLKPGFVEAEAAAAFLSLFPSASTRRQRTTRSLICLPILGYMRDWLGGQAYLLNFARIMGSLPKSRRPRLIVAIGVNDWETVASLQELVDELLACDSVIGVVDSDWRLIRGKPLTDRIARRESGSPPDGRTSLKRLRSIVDWVFPILYPAWGVATVPGPIFWIPDLQHRFWPSFFTAAELAARDHAMGALAARSRPVVFSSRHSEGLFQQWLPQRRCRTHVWHFVSMRDPGDKAASKSAVARDLPARFYFTPNQFWPHKDYASLFRALRRILDAGRDVTFVSTGGNLDHATDPVARSLLDLIRELSLEKNLRLLGVVPRATCLEIMRRACAIIQPSLFEGWSTVIEDARALGRPLIVSDIPVHREQLGESAIFFRPSDPDALAAAVIAADATLPAGPSVERERAASIELARRARSSAEQFLAVLIAEAGTAD